MTSSGNESVFRRERPARQQWSAGELEALKAVHPLHEVAASYDLHFVRSGSRYVALCPFHAEEHPSFTIFPASNRWWCFGYRRGGDVIELIRLLEGISFRDAVERLGRSGDLLRSLLRRHAAGLEGAASADQPARCLAARTSAEGSAALEIAVTCYQRELEEAVAAQRYLARRGVAGELARASSQRSSTVVSPYAPPGRWAYSPVAMGPSASRGVSPSQSAAKVGCSGSPDASWTMRWMPRAT